MIVNLSGIASSTKSAHQRVTVDDKDVGEIWREQVNVLVSKLKEPRRMGLKWRWFAQRAGESGTLGRGTRSSMLLGPGLKGRDAAIAALTVAFTAN